MKRSGIFAVFTVVLISGCNSPISTSDSVVIDQRAELEAYIQIAKDFENPLQIQGLLCHNSINKNYLRFPLSSFVYYGNPVVGDTVSISDDTYITVDTVIEKISQSNAMHFGIRIYRSFQHLDDSACVLDGYGVWSALAEYRTDGEWDITELTQFELRGKRTRQWESGDIVDSIKYVIDYDPPSLDEYHWGKLSLRTKVLDAPFTVGDTVEAVVDSLNKEGTELFGRGRYYNAMINQTLEYDFIVDHRNDETPSNSYHSNNFSQARVVTLVDMKNSNRTFRRLAVEILFHVEHSGDKSSEFGERKILFTTENRDTVAVITGNVRYGEWDVYRNSNFFTP